MSGQIFISYRRDDSSAFAGRIYDRLISRFAEDQIFFDVDNLGLGVDFVEAIEASIDILALHQAKKPATAPVMAATTRGKIR